MKMTHTETRPRPPGISFFLRDARRSTAHGMPVARVLVVADNAGMRTHLYDLLSAQYEVIPAIDGQHALRSASAHSCDLILADIAPPGPDAVELLAALRTDPRTAATPVIFLSAQACPETRIEAIEAGAEDCLLKPVNARELLARVRRTVDLTAFGREALRREERLRTETAGILESMKEGFMLVDADWRILYVNAAGERLSGVSREGLLGRNHWDAYPATLGTIVERKYRQAMATRMAVKFEHYYAPYSRWFESGASPVGDDALLLYAYDITDRKQMEETLRATDARLTAELEAMNRLHDLSTRLLALPDLKTALDEVLDASIAMLDAAMGSIELYNEHTGMLEIVTQRGFHQDFLDHFRMARIDDGGSASARVMKSRQRVIVEDVEAAPDYAPHCRIAASAGYRAVQSTPFVSRSGQLLGVLSTHFRQPHRPSERDLRMLDLYANQATDLIERIRAEQALRESEKRATLILNSMTDGFEVLDDSGRFSYFNAAARRMLAEQGVNADDLIGRQYLTEAFLEARDDESGRGYRRAVADHVPVAVENFFVPFNRWYSIRFFPMDAGGVSIVIEDITERKRAEQALRESEAKFRALAEASPALISQLGPDGKTIYLNRRHLDLFGKNAQQLLDTGWHSIVHPDDAPAYIAAVGQALRDRARFHRRVRVKSRKGEWRWLDAYAAPWFMGDGQYAGHVCIAIDITDAVQLEFAQHTYRMATEGGNEGFYIVRPLRGANGAFVDFELVDSNRRGAEFLGLRRNDLLGKKISTLYEGANLCRPVEILSRAMERGFYEDDVEIPRDSPLRVSWIHCKIVRSNGELAVTVRDISGAKAHVDELERRSNEDALTGLPNRYWLQTYLPQAIACATANHAELAVLFMDLDGFKAVNDALGHSAGDELLRNAARRLKVAVRPQDKVARLGGDEFIIILEDIADKRDAAHVAERVLYAFRENFTLSQGVQSVGTSIGISLFPFDGADADTLLRKADNAMYAVKTSGKRNYCFFVPEFDGALPARPDHAEK